MTVLSAHQPAYMPNWNYLNRIAKSDIHVVLDAVQFERGSFTNRNKILLDGKEKWLTVPVKRGDLGFRISDKAIDNSRDWIKSHLGMIFHGYRKSKKFGRKFGLLKEHLNSKKWGGLADFLGHHIGFWMDKYAIETECRFQGVGTEKHRGSKLVLEICKYYEATTYLSGPLGRDYLDLESFEKEGIEVIFDDTPQEPLSVIDSWMNTKENPFSA